MKESRYNVYLLDDKEQKALVFNTMHRSIVHIDYEVFNLIKDNQIDKIDSEFLEVLKNGKIVVEDNLDELKMLKIMFNRFKYNTASAGFTIIPTHACNLACKYCYQGHGEVLHETMNEETVRRTIEFIKKNMPGHQSIGINFYGGEPLLFPDTVFTVLGELKPYADELGITLSTSFTSNGTLFTEEIAENLKDYNHEIQITLCGPKEIHDKLRVDKKGNGTYETLMNVIALFKKYGTHFHVRVDIDQDNYNTMKELLDDLKERGFGGMYIGFCPIGKDICYTEMELDTERVDAAAAAQLSRMAHKEGFGTNPIFIHNFIEGCSAIFDNFLAIDPKGDVYKCIAAPNYTEHRIGTLDEEGNLVDMNFDTYCEWTLRDPLLIEECVECKFSPICAGGCALTSYSRHGSITAPGCEEENLGEVVRTFIMLNHPELFEGCTYESIVL